MPERCGRGIPVNLATSVIVAGHSSKVSSRVAAKKFSSGIRSFFIALMVINDAYFYGVPFFPKEDDPPLLIHSDTPEPFKVARKLLKMIARWNPHVVDVL
jgi:hypothetical protein